VEQAERVPGVLDERMTAAATADPPIILRDMEGDEDRFIVRSWHSSFMGECTSKHRLWSTSGTTLIQPPLGWALHSYDMSPRAQIWRYMDNSRVVVACLPDVPDEVLGWIAFEAPGNHPLQVHYMFVKSHARQRGVGRKLYQAALSAAGSRNVVHTHRTSDGDKFLAGIET